ncbi:lipoprotein signal peptidase [Campylobacter sp. MIT 99-7217]|uniref:signal peptidase II n=1 Tax=Campylobacter sp. MIT 99-7217 TaxID=535091 RepID=UPI001158C561|nr:signal peptidase II [Campylobacter sp. MIT 99-7217]TQR30640.1 lipoprotein signal peptidase [Campylobacter sp. MIT 99-7217]
MLESENKRQIIKRFALLFVLALFLDQSFKLLCLSLQANLSHQNFSQVITHLQLGFAYTGLFESDFLDLRLVLNRGVAFSMFSFLEHYLKWLHLALLLILALYLFWQKGFLKTHLLAFALMLGSGFSNLLDRFLWDGVVDMFFWHKWFEFAIFNVADVLINISVALIVAKELFLRKKVRS